MASRGGYPGCKPDNGCMIEMWAQSYHELHCIGKKPWPGDWLPAFHCLSPRSVLDERWYGSWEVSGSLQNDLQMGTQCWLMTSGSYLLCVQEENFLVDTLQVLHLGWLAGSVFLVWSFQLTCHVLATHVDFGLLKIYDKLSYFCIKVFNYGTAFVCMYEAHMKTR